MGCGPLGVDGVEGAGEAGTGVTTEAQGTRTTTGRAPGRSPLTRWTPEGPGREPRTIIPE